MLEDFDLCDYIARCEIKNYTELFQALTRALGIFIEDTGDCYRLTRGMDELLIDKTHVKYYEI